MRSMHNNIETINKQVFNNVLFNSFIPCLYGNCCF